MEHEPADGEEDEEGETDVLEVGIDFDAMVTVEAMAF